MADKKISALPAATTPLAGTEVLPIVQGGVTDQVSVANLTSGRDVAVKKLNPTDNVIMAAGKGIDFSANGGDVLSQYDEGTWTGTLTAATPPTTPITKTGRYTRIGNQITIAIEFDNVDTSGASGAMEVTGLPFTAAGSGYGPVMKSGIGADVIMAGIYGGLSKVIFSDAATMSTTNIVAAAGVYLRFSATYYV